MVTNYKPLAWYQLLLQKNMLIVLLLGFSSGLPLALTAGTLQAWFTVEGVDVVTIGFLALVGQPYVYKFLWAPIVDRVEPRFLGRRRGWMLGIQVGLILLLMLMSFFSPAATPLAIGVIALSIAFMSATQDIVIDAYRTEILAPEQRGAGAAMAVAGYRIAIIVSSGIALVWADHIGFQKVYLLMALTMGIAVLTTLWSEEPTHYSNPPPTLIAACLEPLKEFFSRKNAILLLLLIVLYKLGDAFANSLTTTFLIRSLELPVKHVGYINKVVGLAATIIGALIGGVLMTRIGLYRSLLWFGFLQAITNFLFMLLAVMTPSLMMIVFAISVENLASGMGTAAFIALLMSLCHERYTATQFALLSALSAVGRVFVGPFAGYLVAWLGWAEFFFWTVIFALPGLGILIYLKNTIDSETKKTTPKIIEDLA